MKIVIAGGTGFIGKYFSDHFRQEGHEVVIISRRNEHIHWNEMDKITKTLENSDLLINLAGKSVNCRYNEKNKKEILGSRTEATKILGHCLLNGQSSPMLWINASTATIYRDAEDRPMTESTGEIGTGFSVDVAKAWESAFFNFNLPNTRQVALRITIVLGKGGGVIKPYTNMVRLGVGGKQGNGRQIFSWIHMEDLYQMIWFLFKNPALQGVFNAASPNPVTNQEFMKTLRKALHVPLGLPTPEILLKAGAMVIGTEPELLLKSRWVIPERFVGAGFKFRYGILDKALENIFRKK